MTSRSKRACSVPPWPTSTMPVERGSPPAGRLEAGVGAIDVGLLGFQIGMWGHALPRCEDDSPRISVGPGGPIQGIGHGTRRPRSRPGRGGSVAWPPCPTPPPTARSLPSCGPAGAPEPRRPGAGVVHAPGRPVAARVPGHPRRAAASSTPSHDPDLATEITLQPVRRYGVDAAILYSDIVTPVAAIGFGVDVAPGRRPGRRAARSARPPTSTGSAPSTPRPTRPTCSRRCATWSRELRRARSSASPARRSRWRAT